MYFVKEFNKSYKLDKSLSEEAIEELQRYDWPGNIRELENIMERIMISFDGDVITRFQVERTIGVTVDGIIASMSEIEGKSMTEILDDYENISLK